MKTVFGLDSFCLQFIHCSKLLLLNNALDGLTSKNKNADTTERLLINQMKFIWCKIANGVLRAFSNGTHSLLFITIRWIFRFADSFTLITFLSNLSKMPLPEPVVALFVRLFSLFVTLSTLRTTTRRFVNIVVGMSLTFDAFVRLFSVASPIVVAVAAGVDGGESASNSSSSMSSLSMRNFFALLRRTGFIWDPESDVIFSDAASFRVNPVAFGFWGCSLDPSDDFFFNEMIFFSVTMIGVNFCGASSFVFLSWKCMILSRIFDWSFDSIYNYLIFFQLFSCFSSPHLFVS